MIDYLYANNYKSFVNFRIDFSRSNLLIGINGVGKSNVFTLIASIRDVVIGGGRVLEVLFPSWTCTRWMQSNIQTFEIGISDTEDRYVYRLEIEHDVDHMKSGILSEHVTCNGDTLYQMVNGNAEVFDDEHNVNRVLADTICQGLRLYLSRILSAS